jgi:hypothetical protein
MGHELAKKDGSLIPSQRKTGHGKTKKKMENTKNTMSFKGTGYRA